MENLMGRMTIYEPSLPVRLPGRQCSSGALSLEVDWLDARELLHANSLVVHIPVEVQ